MLKQISRRFFGMVCGVILSLLLISCGSSLTPTPTAEVAAPSLSLPSGAKSITLPSELSDYLSKSTPSGSSLNKVYTVGLNEEPAQAATVVDKLLSGAGYQPTGKPLEKDGVFTRFYKTTNGSEAVATYGRPELSVQAYKAGKLSQTVLDQYAITIRDNKTIVGVSIGIGLLKLYGVS